MKAKKKETRYLDNVFSPVRQFVYLDGLTRAFDTHQDLETAHKLAVALVSCEFNISDLYIPVVGKLLKYMNQIVYLYDKSEYLIDPVDFMVEVDKFQRLEIKHIGGVDLLRLWENDNA